MSGKASSSGADAIGRQKRKRVGFAEAPSSMKSPCTKAARGGHFNVFLVGYTEKEKFDIVRSCPDEIDVKDIMSTSITHIVARPPTKKDKAFPYSVMYYAVVSGAWLLRPSWLIRSKDSVVPEAEHEYKHNQVDLQTPALSRFRDILKLYGSYQKMREEEECRFFCDSVFRRVYILANRTSEGRLKKATLKSIIKAGGGSLAADDSWRTIRERPSKANDLVSLVIVENGDDLSVHDINISFVKQLLLRGIPVLYEEILSQLLNNQVVPNLEVMMTHAVYYWCNEHREKLTLSDAELAFLQKLQHAGGDVSMLQKEASSMDVSEKPTVYSSGDVEEKRHRSQPVDDILDDIENEIRENQLKPRRNVVCSPIAEEEVQQHSLVVDDVANESKVVQDDCGLFEIYDFDSEQKPNIAASNEKHSWCDSVSTLSHLVPKALAKSGVESGSFSDSLRQFFDAIMVEMKNNVPSSFIHDFICHEVVTSLRNSLHPPLLPTPNILSRLLHDIAKPEFGQSFDAASAAYRLLMFFLYQFPACNEEGRFYWLQVLTDAPSNDDSSGTRRGSLLEWNNLLSRTAGLRKMILDTFTCGGSNHTLMDFAVSVLEIDLFNMEGCDGLNTSQEISEEEDNCNRTTHSTNDDTLEHLQNSSVLNGVPLSCLVFYDPHERRKRGLDKTAMETCFAIVDNAVSTKSVLCANLCWRLLAVCLEGLRFFLANTMKLFRGEEISVDLQLDIERLGRYLIKKGLNKDEIDRFLPMSWVSDIIHAVA